MLRRMCRSAFAPAAALSAAARVQQQRTVAVYSESDAILQNNSKARGFKSNLWVEEGDSYWTSKLTKLKAGEKSTKLRLPKRFELFNADQFQNLPTKVRESSPLVHTSHNTQKPYGDRFQKALEEKSLHEHFTSKWWITPTEAKKQGWLPKTGMRQRPVTLSFTADTNVFHAEQFENADAINAQTFSGGSRKPFGLDMHEKLRNYVKANPAFKSGLFFSERQAQEYGLAKKPDAQGIELEINSTQDPFVLYNVDQLQNYEAIVDELQRFPVHEPSFLISGRTLIPEFRAAAAASATTHKTQYWVSKRDVDSRRWALKSGAIGCAVPPKFKGFKMYNVYELFDPERAFRVAGTDAN